MTTTYPFPVSGDEFKGKRVLVTGGTKGMGQAMVRRFTLSGASVATTARSPLPDGQAVALFVQTDTFVKEQHGYEGGLNNPMSWERTVEKFHWLSEAFADEDLRNRIVQVVQQLDARPISDLMDLLAQIRCTVVFPRTHPGIQ